MTDYYCQNCSLELVAKPGGICNKCRLLLVMTCPHTLPNTEAVDLPCTETTDLEQSDSHAKAARISKTLQL